MQSITIDAKSFLEGESNWDYIANKGFSPDSSNLNLFLKPGVLNFGWTSTDRGGATLTGNIIASTYDKNNLGNDTYHVDDAGAFYTLSGSTLTKRQTVTADTFLLGTTDFVQFKLATFATTLTRVVQLTGSDLAAVDSSWWTGLTSGYRHPLEVVEDKMYIADVNVIYYYDGVATGTAVTLPTDCNITTLRKHPDGRHLIAFTGYQQNLSHTNGGPGKIYIINKDTLTWEREIQVDTQVEGSRLVGGIVYATYGNKLGYFTGSGIKFLKQLKTSATTYSHNMGNIENFLLIRDGRNVLVFGDLGNGTNSWHGMYRNFASTQNINNLIYKGNGLVLVAYSDGAGAGVLKELSYATVGGSGAFVSNRYSFPSVVKIRRVDIVHDQTNAAGVSAFNVYYKDTEDTTNTILAQISYTNQSVTKTRIETTVTCDMFQLELDPSTGNLGIKQIKIYYEPALQ